MHRSIQGSGNKEKKDIAQGKDVSHQYWEISLQLGFGTLECVTPDMQAYVLKQVHHLVVILLYMNLKHHLCCQHFIMYELLYAYGKY